MLPTQYVHFNYYFAHFTFVCMANFTECDDQSS